MQRSLDRFPQQGSRRPWKMYQNYAFDVMALRLGEVDDGVLQFTRAPSRCPRRAWKSPLPLQCSRRSDA